jgi:hypothetical protein
MKKKLPLIIAIILILVLAVVGWYSYKSFNFRAAIRSLALLDNQLYSNLISMTRSLPKLSLANLTSQAQDNIKKRLEVMERIKALKPSAFDKQIDIYLRLMELENAYANSLIKLKQALLMAESAEAGGMVKEEEVEMVRQVGKKSIAYRKKVFSRDLTKFRSVMETRAAARTEHAGVMRQLINYEIRNAKQLGKIVPKRNLMFQLEKANDQIK